MLYFCPMKKMILGTLVLFAICACTEKPTENKTQAEVNTTESKTDVYRDVNSRIKNDPNDAALYLERGNLAVENDDPELALADLDRSKSLDSLNADIWVFAGQLSFLGHKIEVAKSQFLKALSFDDKQKDALCELAKLNFEERDFKTAYSYANDAIRADEQYYLPYFVKGMILLVAGDTAKAVRSMQTSLDLNPDFYTGYIKLGSLYEQAGKQLALDYYNSAISINEKNVEAYYYKGMYLQNSLNLEEAYEVYDQIISIDSTYAFAYYNKGFICLEHLGEYELGVEQFTKAIKYQAEYFDAFYNRGLCFENLEELSKAELDYRSALQIKPDYGLAALGLSRILDPKVQ
ncbi:MAG: tetratricopeptide (TPR) repeat protein [Flavobacteriales bacterium]|jgi:tetratricopeptide (TPR) repeat protein